MKHLGTKCLETERLILRRFTLADAEAMYRNWASDDAVTRFLTWPTHSDVEISAMVLSDWVSHYEEENYYQWAIVPKEFGQPIGSIAAVRIRENVASVEIGYCIGRAWWHRGIMTEALDAIIRFFMKEVGANRVEARHDPNNPHSGGVMRKCGMIYEGTLRRADRNNQGICDCAIYAIVAGEDAHDL